MKFKFSTVADGIYLLEFDNRFDVAMHFIRAQEYYESPNPDFKGMVFDIWDYIEWYAKDNKNSFSYPADWCGFNIPSHVLDVLYINRKSLPGENKYDKFMRELIRFIRFQTQDKKFYLIGSTMGDTETVYHEVAHGLWNLNAAYMQKQKDNLNALGGDIIEVLEKNLIDMGYTQEVIYDEIQAYLSTGVTKSFSKGLSKAKLNKKVLAPFIETYKEFTESGE